MYLTIDEMLAYTDEERDKWREWFTEHGDEKLKIPLAGEIHQTIGGLIQHILWAELFYAFWMKGKSLTDEDETVEKYKAMAFKRYEDLFDFGEFCRDEMYSFTETADEQTWDEPYDFSGHGFRIKGTARQLIAHILIHEIRHWSQIAVIVRENGIAPPGDHDLIFCKSFGTTIEHI